MASLRRIILINTHLPGVVELVLDGHTNICGTNASGKTTLQRLIPVFYGELPSKVVPKTRSKFGDFYLPKSNSYLIYEYQREVGELCQAVLTHSAKDGVQYRFVDAAYDKSQLLYQSDNGKVTAFEPEQWLVKLTHLKIPSSRKINATSEYRSIIQNDVSSLRGNTQEGIKLRQLAARYSLVAPGHKIRHLEKLVSAVHAKEGKMDTLKTMLAAIFEEDGLVQPITRVKNTKAREWIKQMRQSMRLSALEILHTQMSHIALRLNGIESQLFQLTPLLTQDLAQSKTNRADLQASEKLVRDKITILKQEFNDKESNLNSDLSQASAQLNTTEQQLDQLQRTYDAYQAGDIEQLALDNDALPIWLEELGEQQSQYRILLEQYGDLEQELNQKKLTLNESLERLSIKNRKKINRLDIDREQERQRQGDKKEALAAQFSDRKDTLKERFERQINQCNYQKIQRQTQIDSMGLTEAEQEALNLSDKRLELAQANWHSSHVALTDKTQQHQQARLIQQQAQTQLEQARTLVHQRQQQLRLLGEQINPVQGSLRHFLRHNVDGWENVIGKVINPDLLERLDLAPQLTDHTGDCYGIGLRLSEISPPAYAQDEAALRHHHDDISAQLVQAKAQQGESEKSLTLAHTQVKQLHDEQITLKQILTEQTDELTFAKESKQRLMTSHQDALTQRRIEASQALVQAQEKIEQLTAEKSISISELTDDYHSQLLEFKADWQQVIEDISHNMEELEGQIEQKRSSNKAQVQQLEHAFKQELAQQDIDPKTLESLKQRIKTLETDIGRVRSRQEELREYRNFMAVLWQRSRPEYLEQEVTLKALLQQLTGELAQKKSQFKQDLRTLEQAQEECHNDIVALAKLIDQLTPLTNKLIQLPLDPQRMNEIAPMLGDQQERIIRASAGLEQRSKTQVELKETLNQFESQLIIDAQKSFLDLMNSELSRLDKAADVRERLPILSDLLRILADQQRQILEQGETIGGDLHKFFTVFSDINRRISGQSKRLTAAVCDDLTLDGINRSQVKIISTVDELNFWQPLKRFSKLYELWKDTGKELPSDEYIDALSDVVDLLRADSSYTIESLLRLELHLNEGGHDLVIKNDRQLLESSSHGMAYLILCKFLLAFTRLLRGDAQITVNWPIDEIGTLAYHNVEKLFSACQSNNICIVGAFPNPESDVLTLFKNRYLIDKQYKRLQRIEPKVNRIEVKIAQQLQREEAVQQGAI